MSADLPVGHILDLELAPEVADRFGFEYISDGRREWCSGETSQIVVVLAPCTHEHGWWVGCARQSVLIRPADVVGFFDAGPEDNHDLDEAAEVGERARAAARPSVDTVTTNGGLL